MSVPPQGAHEVVAILAPTGQDGPVTQRVLGDAGIASTVCANLNALCELIQSGCGAILLASEALGDPDIGRLEELLATQPNWSDLPLVVITANLRDHPFHPGELLLERLGNVTLLERPLHVITIALTLRAALRARRRQYQLRDHLAERDRLEARLREGQHLESLGVLAGGVAHDFNNLLTPIVGNAELLLEDIPAQSPLRERLDDIVEAARSATTLTQQMLAYAGKGHLTMSVVELSTLVGSIVRLLKGSIRPSIDVQLELAEGLPRVKADTAQLQQVVMNLVINGAESMAGAGTLKVATEARRLSATQAARLVQVPPPGAYVVVSVSDTGCGMDALTLARIFEPFFTTKFTGRGLGLSAVYGIIRRHGGGLGIRSVPGGGTTFEVYLPVSATEAVPEPPPPRTEGPRRGSRVLLVDDDASVRRLATAYLEQGGYSVIGANSGPAVIDELRAHAAEVALVLLDATMPGMTGDQTLAHLKAIRPDLRVVVMSGFGAQEMQERFRDPAVVGYLSKPFTREGMLRAIERALEAR